MTSLIRNTAVTSVGVLAALATLYLIEDIGHRWYPMPSDFNLESHQDRVAYIRSLPLGAHAFQLSSYLLGSFIGGFTGNFLSKSRQTSVVVGIIILGIAFWYITHVPHPAWFNIAALMIPIPSALWGGQLSKSLALNRLDE